MSEKLSDDIYIIFYYDQEESEMSIAIAENLESLKEYMAAFKVLSWVNITGSNMEIGEFQYLGDLKIGDEVTVSQVEPKPGKKKKKNDK